MGSLLHFPTTTTASVCTPRPPSFVPATIFGMRLQSRISMGNAKATTHKRSLLLLEWFPLAALLLVVCDFHVCAGLSLGVSYSCAITADTSLWCFGRNADGQLGDGSNNNSDVPVQVQDLTGVIDVAAGGYHTCAILSNATLWCFGWNNYGQLGNPSVGTGFSANSDVPVRVPNITVLIDGGDSSTDDGDSSTDDGDSSTDSAAAYFEPSWLSALSLPFGARASFLRAGTV